MASESTAKVVEKKAPSAVPKDRRYVGSKETFAYILDDIAQSFNIGKYDDVFKMNILKIDLVLQSVTNGVISVWDIINDLFLATIVDKTRTRWGKFKPWLVVYAVPGVILTVLYWALPMFMGTDGIGSNIPRFAIYLILQIFSNLAGFYTWIEYSPSKPSLSHLHRPSCLMRFFASRIWYPENPIAFSMSSSSLTLTDFLSASSA